MNHTATHARWRVLPVHLVAKLFGVLINVEGMPFGSNRTHLANPPRREELVGGRVCACVTAVSSVSDEFLCDQCNQHACGNCQRNVTNRPLVPRVASRGCGIPQPCVMFFCMVASGLLSHIALRYWV